MTTQLAITFPNAEPIVDDVTALRRANNQLADVLRFAMMYLAKASAERMWLHLIVPPERALRWCEGMLCKHAGHVYDPPFEVILTQAISEHMHGGGATLLSSATLAQLAYIRNNSELDGLETLEEVVAAIIETYYEKAKA